MEPIVRVVRRWAVDWLSAADPSVGAEILTPDYRLSIGGYLLEGRDAYLEATVAQLRRFAGLGVTIHELVCSGDRVALRFTEHGADARAEARTAAWGGVALHRWDGSRLTESFAEEDYHSRKRQLATGRCDPIESPMPAPWNTVAQQSDPQAEEVVRVWLEEGEFGSVEIDDSWRGHEARIPLADVQVELDALFSAGPRVAFHGTLAGRYRGGLDGVEAATGARASLHFAGLVSVEGDAVVRGRVISDRLGSQRALSAAVAP